MSWYNKTKMICKDCDKEFVSDISTLTIVSQEAGKCPYCNSKNTKIKTQ